MPLTSRLELTPDYVQAIGMISIENANMELALADLFSRTLGLSLGTGRAIYLMPKSALARIEIFQNAAEAMLNSKSWRGNERHKKQVQCALSSVLSILDRAKKAIGKRHGVIHDQWDVNSDTDEVKRRSLGKPATTDGTASLDTLERLILSMREIISQSRQITSDFHKDPPYLVDMRTDR